MYSSPDINYLGRNQFSGDAFSLTTIKSSDAVIMTSKRRDFQKKIAPFVFLNVQFIWLNGI